jgi:soluble P-type ATPase
MIKLDIPGRGVFDLENIALDLNGTLSVDGKIHPKVRGKINLLAKRAKIYVLTADTRGQANHILDKLHVETVLLSGDDTSREKAEFVHGIGPNRTVAIGNGYNDRLMVKEAALGFCIVGKEGAFAETVTESDVVFQNVLDAVDFLLRPLRNRATLRQ